MKIGPVDGSVKECRDFFENNGLNLDDYIEKPPAPLKTRYIVIPSVLFACTLLVMIFVGNKISEANISLLYIFAFSVCTWLTVSVQLRFKNSIATFCVAMGVILTLLIAAGVLSPKEAADYVKGAGPSN